MHAIIFRCLSGKELYWGLSDVRDGRTCEDNSLTIAKVVLLCSSGSNGVLSQLPSYGSNRMRSNSGMVGSVFIRSILVVSWRAALSCYAWWWSRRAEHLVSFAALGARLGSFYDGGSASLTSSLTFTWAYRPQPLQKEAHIRPGIFHVVPV